MSEESLGPGDTTVLPTRRISRRSNSPLDEPEDSSSSIAVGECGTDAGIKKNVGGGSSLSDDDSSAASSSPSFSITDGDDSDADEDEIARAVAVASEAAAKAFGWKSDPTQGVVGENRVKERSIETAPPLAPPQKAKTATGSKTKRQQNSSANFKKNALTELIPGYTAPMRLESSSASASNARGGFAAFRRHSDQKQRSPWTNTTAITSRRERSGCGGFIPTSSSSFKMGTRRKADGTAGSGWFNMVPSELTDELKTDLSVIRNRTYLDPKRFYKSADSTTGKVLQLGTVIEGSTEYYSSRLSKKERRVNLTEEIMADPATASYAKDKFRTMQRENRGKRGGRKSQRNGRPAKKGRKGY